MFTRQQPQHGLFHGEQVLTGVWALPSCPGAVSRRSGLFLSTQYGAKASLPGLWHDGGEGLVTPRGQSKCLRPARGWSPIA